jgi:hypothetical protein
MAYQALSAQEAGEAPIGAAPASTDEEEQIRARSASPLSDEGLRSQHELEISHPGMDGTLDWLNQADGVFE